MKYIFKLDTQLIITFTIFLSKKILFTFHLYCYIHYFN